MHGAVLTSARTMQRGGAGGERPVWGKEIFKIELLKKKKGFKGRKGSCRSGKKKTLNIAKGISEQNRVTASRGGAGGTQGQLPAIVGPGGRRGTLAPLGPGPSTPEESSVPRLRRAGSPSFAAFALGTRSASGRAAAAAFPKPALGKKSTLKMLKTRQKNHQLDIPQPRVRQQGGVDLGASRSGGSPPASLHCFPRHSSPPGPHPAGSAQREYANCPRTPPRGAPAVRAQGGTTTKFLCSFFKSFSLILLILSQPLGSVVTIGVGARRRETPSVGMPWGEPLAGWGWGWRGGPLDNRHARGSAGVSCTTVSPRGLVWFCFFFSWVRRLKN